MKFYFALLGVLCAHALAQDETRALSFIPDASVVVLKKKSPTQSSKASLMSGCSSAPDEINVGVQGILSKNGVEYVYLPMTAYHQFTCFESYNNTVLTASDLFSCCDAAAAGGYNSFRFDIGRCTGFRAWLSPIYTQCAGNGLVSHGLFVAKQKLSNFTSRAPSFTKSISLMMARIVVDVTAFIDDCKFSQKIKVTTYSKTETIKLNLLKYFEYHSKFYIPELCNDSASTDKRTVTISILDGDGSELSSVTEVASSGLTGRHLLSNGVCIMYNSTPLRTQNGAYGYCNDAAAYLPFGDGYIPLSDLLQELSQLPVQIVDFWTFTGYLGKWIWITTNHSISMSLFNANSLNDSSISEGAATANLTDGLLYMVDEDSLRPTVCIDASYFMFPPV